MHRKPAATGKTPPLPLQILDRLLADDPDGALALGLMDYQPSPGDDTLDPRHPHLSQRLREAQQRLQAAWNARERYRARAARLARRAAERDARRTPPPPADRPVPSLPPLAAAILAKAKAKAAGRNDQ
jgi:hypothetical protein